MFPLHVFYPHTRVCFLFSTIYWIFPPIPYLSYVAFISCLWEGGGFAGVKNEMILIRSRITI